jgi:predicted phosphodiesterase
MKTLVITDLHLTDRPYGTLETQVRCIKRIFDEESPSEVIIMGDLTMHRKPSPSVLVALDTLIRTMGQTSHVVILRGNHDSENRSDDGVTALSLLRSDKVEVICQTKKDDFKNRLYIPHYEDERVIVDALQTCSGDCTVFGHFGYVGCLNSRGDADFSITLDRFNCRTYLGHIHRHRRDGLVTILGTPYTTNYGESGKECYYAILSDEGEELKKITHGPRHLQVDISDLLGDDSIFEYINDPEYTTSLRVMMEAGISEVPYDKLDVHNVEIRYKAAFDEEHISNYSPKRDLFKLNEVIIDDYVSSANTDIPKENIMEGFRLLQDED